MKKLSIFTVVLMLSMMSYAQHQVNSFFDDMGMISLETQELQESSNTLVNVFHRADDVVWSRVVYRIVDMRMKQNYQLYTPLTSDDPQYSSLFRTMLRAIEQGMPIYEKSNNVGDIKPYFTLGEMPKELIPTILNTDREGIGSGDIATSEYMLLNYDSVSGTMSFNGYAYENFVRNQLKFMIQEVVFFDKHYSRMYSKILAIAPMHADNVDYYEDMPVMDAIYGQILFWVPFDAFRPYMAQQYVTPRGNDTKRVTYDDFFSLRMYSSYIVGVNNVYGRMIPEIATTPEAIKKEQDRIEWELLSAEQDLWEY